MMIARADENNGMGKREHDEESEDVNRLEVNTLQTLLDLFPSQLSQISKNSNFNSSLSQHTNQRKTSQKRNLAMIKTKNKTKQP
jgi:hypothetical protein